MRERRFTKGLREGVREGAIKGSVDKAVSPITGPVASNLNARLQMMNANAKIVAPMVDSALMCALILGFAELLDVAAPYMGDRSGTDLQKLKLAAEFLREYGAEKVGVEVVDLAISFVPLIMSAFEGFSSEELLDAMESVEKDNFADEASVLVEPEYDIEIPMLFDEGDDCYPVMVAKEELVVSR